MRQLIVFGLLAGASLIFAGCGGLFLIAVLLLAAADSGGYSPAYQPYVGQYSPQGDFSYPPPAYTDGGLRGDQQWNGRLSSGTTDSSGQGNDVISVGGQVLTLP